MDNHVLFQIRGRSKSLVAEVASVRLDFVMNLKSKR